VPKDPVDGSKHLLADSVGVFRIAVCIQVVRVQSQNVFKELICVFDPSSAWSSL
jgi:hypothetical protein